MNDYDSQQGRDLQQARPKPFSDLILALMLTTLAAAISAFIN